MVEEIVAVIFRVLSCVSIPFVHMYLTACITSQKTIIPVLHHIAQQSCLCRWKNFKVNEACIIWAMMWRRLVCGY
jgi:hypothetical protein